MKNYLKIILIFFLVAFVANCKPIGKIESNICIIDSSFTTSKTIMVGFKDNRIMVIDGSQKPAFVGYGISMVGIHWPVDTKSGKAITDLFADSLVDAMRKTGIKASQVYLRHNVNRDSAMKIFTASGKDRFTLVKVKEWTGYAKGQDVMVYEVKYDLGLEVFNYAGKLLVTNDVSGKSEVRGGAVGNMDHMIALSNETFRQQMRLLFLNDSVKAALK
jgi:hypothetical protein